MKVKKRKVLVEFEFAVKGTDEKKIQDCIRGQIFTDLNEYYQNDDDTAQMTSIAEIELEELEAKIEAQKKWLLKNRWDTPAERERTNIKIEAYNTVLGVVRKIRAKHFSPSHFMKPICANCEHYGKDKGGGYCDRAVHKYRVRVDGRQSAQACREFKPLYQINVKEDKV